MCTIIIVIATNLMSEYPLLFVNSIFQAILIISIFKEDNVFSMTANLPHGPPIIIELFFFFFGLLKVLRY